MTYAQDIAKHSGDFLQYVVIERRRCDEVYGVSPCTASGGQCRYSFSTCEDLPNFNNGKQLLKFSSKDAPYILFGDDVQPTLVSVSPIDSEIDPNKAITIDVRRTFLFEDDENPAPPDHDKGAGKFATDRTGTYWKNFVAVNPNFKFWKITSYEGLSTYTESQFQKKFEGIISNIQFEKDGRVKITATDEMKKFKNIRIPNAVSSNNVLQSAVTSGATTLPVLDGSEFKLLKKNNLISLESDNGSSLDVYRTSDINDWDFQSAFTTAVVAAGTLQGLAYRPDTDILYTTEFSFGADRLRSISRVDNDLVDIGPMATSIRDITWDRTNSILYGTSGNTLYTINTSTGTLTSVGSHGATYTAIRGLAYDHINSILYGIDSSVTDNLVTINVVTGAATLVSGALGLGSIGVAYLCYDSEQGALYSTDTTNQKLIEVNVSTGAGTTLSDYLGEDGLEYMDVQLDAYVKCEDEKMRLTAISGNDLTVERGSLGDTAVAHAIGQKVIQVAVFADPTDTGVSGDLGVNPVDAMIDMMLVWVGLKYSRLDWAQLLLERDTWVQSQRFKRAIEKPVEAEKLLAKIRRSLMGNLWKNESQKITFRVLAPPGPHDTNTTIVEDDDIIEGSTSIDLKYEDQITRVIVYFEPSDGWGAKDSSDTDDYDSILFFIDADVENSDNFDEERTLEVFFEGVYDITTARSFAAKYIRRYGVPPAEIRFDLFRKDSALQTGDIMDLTSSMILQVDGSDSTENCQVVSKQENRDGRIKYKVRQTRTRKRYGYIGHSATSGTAYDSASDEDKRHCYIGATTTNLVGAAEDDGYYLW